MTATLILAGCGNMGYAMLAGWIAAGHLAPNDVIVVEPTDALRERAAKLGVTTHADAAEIAGDAAPRLIVLAVKPQVMATVTRMIDPYSATLNGLILAGGGAPFVEQPLRRVWHNIITAPGEDSRYMVAEGMARWGAGVLLARRAALSASPA